MDPRTELFESHRGRLFGFDLTLLVVAINGWNRINIASRNLGGNYRPAKH